MQRHNDDVVIGAKSERFVKRRKRYLVLTVLPGRRNPL